MVRRKPKDDLAGEAIIGTEYRSGQTASTPPRKRDCVGGVAVRHDGRDRTEDLHIVDGSRRLRIARQQQQRRHECAPRAVGALHLEVIHAARDHIGLAAQLGEPGQNVVPLFLAHQGTHAHALQARIAHDDFPQRRLQGADHIA